MIYYLIYFLDYKCADKIIGKNTSKFRNTTLIETIALEYIKEFQGKQQIDICKAYEKTPEQILADATCKDGLYLRRDNDDESILLYEKGQLKVAGTIWNSVETKINKIGKFGIMEIEIDNTNNIYDIKLSPLDRKVTAQNEYTFLDQLKQLMQNGAPNAMLKKARKYDEEKIDT